MKVTLTQESHFQSESVAKSKNNGLINFLKSIISQKKKIIFSKCTKIFLEDKKQFFYICSLGETYPNAQVAQFRLSQ